MTEGTLKRVVVDTLLFVAILIVAAQGQSILHAIDVRRALAASPVTYDELIPDREEYFPGDLIRFTYNRKCKGDNADLPLIMLTVDSFENLDTGEIFVGTFASRIVRRNGTEHLQALRRLSTDCTPGIYAFEGWVSIQGVVPTQPVPYSSRKFKVLPALKQD